jgi:hypothetical protein
MNRRGLRHFDFSRMREPMGRGNPKTDCRMIRAIESA